MDLKSAVQQKYGATAQSVANAGARCLLRPGPPLLRPHHQ